MLAMLDDDPNEPPPTFTFSSLLALVAASGTAWWEATMLWSLEQSSLIVSILLLPFVMLWLMLPALGTVLLCCAAMYFGPVRWGVLGLAILIAPYPVLAIYLVLTR